MLTALVMALHHPERPSQNPSPGSRSQGVDYRARPEVINVPLSRRQALVAECLLNDAEIDLLVGQTRGERMSQTVSMNSLGQAGLPAEPLEQVADVGGQEGLAFQG